MACSSAMTSAPKACGGTNPHFVQPNATCVAIVIDRKLLVTLDRDETGIVIAECPSIPGCVSQGHTEEEALDNVREAIEGCLAARAANGMPLTVRVREVEVAV